MTKIMGWIGVDLDKTLAEYTGWKGKRIYGRPIQKMVERVKKYLAAGIDMRIFTARIDDHDKDAIIKDIEKWCLDNIGQVLPVTNVKTLDCIEIWDDRARQIVANTGEMVGESCVEALFKEE